MSILMTCGLRLDSLELRRVPKTFASPFGSHNAGQRSLPLKYAPGEEDLNTFVPVSKSY